MQRFDGIDRYFLPVDQMKRFILCCKPAREVTDDKLYRAASGSGVPGAKSYAVGGDVNSGVGGDDCSAAEGKEMCVEIPLATQRPAGNVYCERIGIPELDELLVRIAAGGSGIDDIEVDNDIVGLGVRYIV